MKQWRSRNILPKKALLTLESDASDLGWEQCVSTRQHRQEVYGIYKTTLHINCKELLEFLIQSRQLTADDLVGSLDEDSYVDPLISCCRSGVGLEVPLTSLEVEETMFVISIRA